MKILKGIYSKTKKNKKRTLLIVSGLVLFLCCVILFITYKLEIQLPVVSKESPWAMLGKEIIQGVIIAILTMLSLYIVNWMFDKKDLEEQHDAEMSERIWYLLRAQKPDDNIINELYSCDAVTDIMRNSASYFSESLANTFCNMLKNQTCVIRENFEYKISIYRLLDTCLQEDTYFQGEVLRYKRHFKPSKPEIELKCCFAFNADTLDKVLADNSYFFREIISDKKTVDCVTDALRSNDTEDKIKEMVIKCLHLKISLYDNKDKKVPVKASELTMTREVNPDTDEICGITFSKVIGTIEEDGRPDEKGFLSRSENGKCSYKAEVECKFNIPSSNYFICVFADPMIGQTKFNIKFSPNLIQDVATDVEKFTFLTMETKPDNLFDNAGEHELSFQTSDVIIPTSAIFIQWKTPAECNYSQS